MKEETRKRLNNPQHLVGFSFIIFGTILNLSSIFFYWGADDREGILHYHLIASMFIISGFRDALYAEIRFKKMRIIYHKIKTK